MPLHEFEPDTTIGEVADVSPKAIGVVEPDAHENRHALCERTNRSLA